MSANKLNKESPGFLEIRINYDRILLMPVDEGLELLKLINKGQWLSQTWAASSSQQYAETEPDITFQFRKADWLELIRANNMISKEE